MTQVFKCNKCDDGNVELFTERSIFLDRITIKLIDTKLNAEEIIKFKVPRSRGRLFKEGMFARLIHHGWYYFSNECKLINGNSSEILKLFKEHESMHVEINLAVHVDYDTHAVSVSGWCNRIKKLDAMGFGSELPNINATIESITLANETIEDTSQKQAIPVIPSGKDE